MEIKNKAYGTPKYKYLLIWGWKQNGIIHDNFDALFEEYIATTSCQHCATPFKSTRDRHIDHDHDTGQVRLIVCHKCNTNDSYINWPDGYDEKQYNAEYRQKNKEKIEEYRQKNKEKILEQSAEYYKQNKEKITKQHAEYYQQNKENIAEKRAERYQKNKEKIAEQQAEKVKCECGDFIRRDGFVRHRKTQKHLSKI